MPNGRPQTKPRRSSGSPRRKASTLVLAMIAIGLGLRIWYASEALNIDRFVDEKYSLQNIRSIVTERTLEPASSYYPYPLFNLPPAALVAGSDALHRWTGAPRFEAIKPEGYGPAAFLLTRLVQALYGALAIYLLYLIGRQIFSREVGLISALALAFMPWHIHASGYFKPDAQLVAMVLLAFYASIQAVQHPSWRSSLIAGCGIALAMSTKMTGGLIAMPLVVGTLATGWRDKHRLGQLTLAGAVSAGIFVLLNPYWRYYPVWLSGLERDYAMRAARQGMTRAQIPGRVAELMTDPYTLGPWLGALGLAAFVVLAIRSVRHSRTDPVGRAWIWMLLSFPLVYTAAYAWKTPYFKDNNFLPVIPFFCLSTGWAVVGIWRRASTIWPTLTRVPARALAVFSICVVLMPPGLRYTYRTTTPTTLDRALALLGRKMRPADGRLVLVEEISVERPVWEGRRRFGRGRSRVESVEDWRAVPMQKMDLADGAVFLPDEKEPVPIDDGTWQEERLFEPRLFRLRGPTLVAALNNWRRAGPPIALPVRRCRPSRRCVAANLPPQAGDAESITLVVTLGFARGESVEDVTAIRVGDREVTLLLASGSERGAVFLTEKLVPPEGPETVTFLARKKLLRKNRFGIELHRWKRAAD